MIYVSNNNIMSAIKRIRWRVNSTPKSVIHGSERLECRSQMYDLLIYYRNDVYYIKPLVTNDPKIGRRPSFV